MISSIWLHKMTSPKMHDPLFHFETHFPERLSRLHLNPEFCPQVPSRASRRSRAQRKCGRYKTQPITFDEITEVDEENVQDEPNEDNIKQLQEFSRSMDGLVIKTAKNSRRHHAKCDLSIPEDRNNNKRQESVQARLQTESLKDNKENHPKMKNNNSEPIGLPPTGLSPARDPRRQRITAKAKRRQMMDELQKDNDQET
ncbi:uncharacterized protein [Mytilus edulis]|uniref:uncharacterized protein isoform X2 n=1 Tax=Mytilus edulis TaxID=6550 RepID=UPI0039EF24A7